MAYATPADMEARFGLNEMIRLSTADGSVMGTAVSVTGFAMIEEALAAASEMVDSYLRRRYATPLDVVPLVVKRLVMTLARFDLAHGDQREPSEQMTKEHDGAIAWLKSVRDGTVLLDLAEVPTSDESFAQTSDRTTAPFQQGAAFQPQRGFDTPMPATNESFGTYGI